MKAEVIFTLDGKRHPAQDIAFDLLFPWIDVQIEAALVVKAKEFPKKKRKAMIKEWRSEIQEAITLHYGYEAGYYDVLLVQK